MDIKTIVTYDLNVQSKIQKLLFKCLQIWFKMIKKKENIYLFAQNIKY